MNKHQTLFNMASNIIAFIISMGTTFLLTPYIVAKVGSEAYSFISISNSFIAISSIITIALNSMASRFISIEIHRNRINKANEYFSSVFVANIILSVVLTIPSIICVIFLDSILNIPKDILFDVRLTFIFVFINMIISLVGNIFAVATFAKNRLDLSSVRLIQGNLIRALFIFVLFLFFDPKIFFVTVTNLIVILFTLITNIRYTKKLLPEIKFSLSFFNKNAIMTLLSSGIWNSLNQLSNVLLNQLDLLTANILVNAIAGGQYSIVQTVPSFMISLISMLTGVFIPKFTFLYAKNSGSELIESIKSSIKIISILITPPIGFLLIFGDVFFGLWIPGENSQFLHLLSQVTLIPLVITGSGNMIFNIFTITNKLKLPSLVMLLSGVIKVILIVFFLNITDWGVIIIPIVSAVINILNYFTFIPIYAAKCLNTKLSVFYIPMLKSVGCTITMLIVCNIFKNSIEINTWSSLFIIAGLCAMITILINFFILFTQKERKEMLSQF